MKKYVPEPNDLRLLTILLNDKFTEITTEFLPVTKTNDV